MLLYNAEMEGKGTEGCMKRQLEGERQRRRRGTERGHQ